MEAPGRPVMRYHGGKWRLAHWVISHFPRHRIYIEPYGGAASVLIQKPRSYAEIYNDIGDEVVNVFRVLRDPATAAELEKLLRLTPFARSEFELAYQPCDEPVERARRIIVRSFFGYGTAAATRPDKTGFRGRGFDQRVPSAVEWSRYPDEIRKFTERLKGVTLENRPALDLVRGFDQPDTLIYADPPYVLSTRSSAVDRRKHYPAEMTDEDHVELAEAVHASGAMVIVSGYRCPLYDELYGDWRRVETEARSMMNVPRTECLWISPRTSAALEAERVERERRDQGVLL